MKDGGPAYPTVISNYDGGASEGMTLRDWFAGQALAGAIADLGTDIDEAYLARWCCNMADAMLEAREK